MGECPSTNVAPAVDELVEALVSRRSAVVAVTNEVGLGIVPENALARAFRDATGFLNQRVAAIADEVFLLVAGQPLRVK
jgi:adenosylcobinamide kinase / adenosylcobinamide-phosphate guanylyltransferase